MSWFVTGTDTGVGKTVVAAAICRTVRDTGRAVVYVKPVQSGAADGDDDAADVSALADVPTVVGPVIGPSLAPAVAARLAEEELTGAELVEVVRSAAEAHPDAHLVVEGAGGLLVELGSDGTTCADLAEQLGFPVVVVARPGLGTLNHTALTVTELERRGLALAGVVVSGFPSDPDLATRTNVAELDRIAGGKLIGVLPHLDLLEDDPLAEVESHLGSALYGTWEPDLAAAYPPPTGNRSPTGNPSGAPA